MIQKHVIFVLLCVLAVACESAGGAPDVGGPDTVAIADTSAVGDAGATDVPVADTGSADVPILTDTGSADIPVVTDTVTVPDTAVDTGSADIPVGTDTGSADIPVGTDTGSADIPVVTDTGSADISVGTDTGSADIPVGTDTATDAAEDIAQDTGGCITPPELCNGIDDDLDGLTDEDFDLDEDGWTTCDEPPDCDDGNYDVHPQADEIPCNETDDDCDADTPDVPSETEIPCNGADDDCDADTPDVPSETEIPCNGVDDDCDADTPDVPSETEIPCNGADDDCNPDTPDGPDEDGDEVSVCAGDCDDTDGDVYPGNVEQPCNGKDDDCDESTSDVPSEFEIPCNGADDDCDPETPDVPGEVEILCNGVDDDCDADTLDAPPDGDDDGVTLCDEPPDCDDTDGGVFPGNEEILCNGKDDDCDPETVDMVPDGDDDGVTLCDEPPDCDDTRGDVYPGNEEIPCDDVDNDCDGLQDEDTHFPSDPDYCGSCGVVCDESEHCYLGVCEAGRPCPDDMVRVGDHCVDRYEASRPDATATSRGFDESVAVSVAGVLPWYVNPVDAEDMAVFEAACVAAGKHLCTATEWFPACAGPDDNLYSWGDVFDPYVCNCVDTYCQEYCDQYEIDPCNTADGCGYWHYYYSGYGAPFHAVPTWTHRGCTSEYGAFDINGNVWEIVVSDSDPPDARGFEVRGGAFNCGGASSRLQCTYNANWTSLYAGFRCCKAFDEAQ